jgi:hypothetical protein
MMNYMKTILILSLMMLQVISVSPHSLNFLTDSQMPQEHLLTSSSGAFEPAGHFTDECLGSFDVLATTPVHPFETAQPPLPPWQKIPASSSVSGTILLSRLVAGVHQLWFSDQQTYLPETDTWLEVNTELESTQGDVLAFGGWITDDGRVWGFAASWVDETQSRLRIRLSLFNDSTLRYELLPNGPDLTLDRDELASLQIVFRAPDKFLFIGDFARIYIVNVEQQLVTTIPNNLPSQSPYSAPAPRGNLYFNVFLDSEEVGPTLEFMQPGMLLELDAETGNVSQLDVPVDNWRRAYSILTDRSGRLWIGSRGYRIPNGKWVTLSSIFGQSATNPGYNFGRPFFSGSDGRVWFLRWADTSNSRQGMAWYDPATDEGCMFSNRVGFNMVEDHNGDLWMVVDDDLYYYDSHAE